MKRVLMRGQRNAHPRPGRRKAKHGGIRFFKVSGAGNHFVLLDLKKNRPPMAKGDLARAFCVQGYSVGADGVLFLEKSATTDFKLFYYNADGGEAQMCGNGARCAAVYAFENGIAPSRMIFETRCGLIKATARRGSAELDMGPPRDFRKKMKVRTRAGTFEGSFVNTGVPHFVVIVRNVTKLPVESLGRELRFHKSFASEGANIDFVQLRRGRPLLVRTYERGIEAETLACGTGAVAVAVCLGAKGLVKSPVLIETRGGDTLAVRYAEKANPLSSQLLEGPAHVIFEGQLPLSALRKARERFRSGE